MTFTELLTKLQVPPQQEAATLDPSGAAIYQLPEQNPNHISTIEGIHPIPLDLAGFAAFNCPVEGGTARIVAVVSPGHPTPTYTGCLAAFRPA